MKRLMIPLLAGLVLTLTQVAGAVDLGPIAVNDTANFPIVCVDTLGRKATPDSTHVLVRYHGAGVDGTTWDSTNSAAGATGPWADSTRKYGVTYYHFIHLVGDIDGTSGNGVYTGEVITWNQGEAFENPFSFTKVGDATASGDNLLNHFLVEAQPGVDVEEISGDSPAADNAESFFDGTGYAGTGNTIPTVTDITNAVTADTVNKAVLVNLDNATGNLAATQFENDFLTAAKIANDAFDYATFAATAPTAWWFEKTGSIVSFDGLNTDLSSTHGAGGWATATGFATHSAADVWTAGSRALSTPNDYKADVSALALEATVQIIDDSLDNQDNWVAKEATVAGLNDVAAVDFWNVAFGTGFSAGSMGDSLNNPTYVQGAGGATAAQIWAYYIQYSDFAHALPDSAQAAWLMFWAGDSSAFATVDDIWGDTADTPGEREQLLIDAGTGSGTDSGAVYGAVVQFHEDSLADANVTQISGSSTAADNHEEAFDGDATGAGNIDDVQVTSIDQGVIDSSAFNLTAYYEFWAYNDSTPADLGNELAQWLINNLGVAGSSPWSQAEADSVLQGLLRASGDNANYFANLADTTKERLLRTLLVPGYPTDGDTVSALLAAISTIKGYTAGSGSEGVDWWVEQVAADVNALVDEQIPIQVRYIDDDGDGSDGLTIATADTNFNVIETYTSPTVVYVLPGDYAAVACTVDTDGIDIEAVGGAGMNSIRGIRTSGGDTIPVFHINPGSTTEIRGIRFSGLNISYPLSDTGYQDDGPPNPGYKAAMMFGDNVSYVEIDNCIFPDSSAVSSYKTITVSDSANKYFNIHDNIFYHNRTICIDAGFDVSQIHHNSFILTDSVDVIGPVKDAISLYTGAQYNLVYENYFIGGDAAISMVAADSNLVFANHSGLTVNDPYVSDASSAGNVYAGNQGGNQGYFGVDAGNSPRQTVEEEMNDRWSANQMNPLPGSYIPNGHVQVHVGTDTANVAGWGTNLGAGGTVWLSAENPFEGYARSMLLINEGIKTRTITLDTGYYEMSAQIWHGLSADSTKFICYVNCADAVNWINGATEVWASGYTDWRGHQGIIHIDSLDEYCFAIQAGDSAYVAEVALRPFSTIGHTATASLSASEAAKLDSVFRSVGWPGISHFIPTLQMKAGDYSGAIGSNIEDDFDTTLAHIAALSLTGGGTEPETLIVMDTGDSTLIQGARIVVRTIDQSTVKVPGLNTDVNGKRILELDADSFFVAITANNYMQTLDTLVVASGGGTDTLWMTLFSPSQPSDTGMVVVYIWTDDVLGEVIEGATFAISPIVKGKNWRTDGGRVIMPRTETKATNSLGYAEIEVYQSAYVHPYKYKDGDFEVETDSLKYNITLYYEDYGRFDIFKYIANVSNAQIGGE